MLLFVIVPLALFVWAIVSVAQTPAEPTPKVLWVLVVLFFPLLGPILWFTIGRPAALQKS
ncbi:MULTISPECIES: PLD nuclease N-terminal domain-containing protein [unclassified Diaminobutyricimonas]|uniref:PLD nuclease N-terminal domain-containing protein n=1 Tax=unclassified Diaminobutyricimonas TaxID=2643261 RepID=UPI0012F51E00|nr:MULTISPECIES: PLD nuclease N-terminal domain-containing protein [unclassified Diaminobutyricimonas]